ncbi:hypothetical protein D5F01_LYC17455 [Larimichthys crocea]|uniref:Uncharacterized protein n=1 Tax=Larimichthys crocea TaxID=215358 RepID=A0A6G0HYG2_LARCR|nr:hypothetical protein D5F01_LYC17455 [Larimichthys crocea]
MRSLGLVAFALHTSLLVLLAQGIQRKKDGVEDMDMRSGYERFSVMDRSTGYHLPTYMMHLYRNFKSNFSRPMDIMEQDAAKQADTVKSVVAKSLTHRQRRWVATFDLHALLADKQIQACRAENQTSWDSECFQHHRGGLSPAQPGVPYTCRLPGTAAGGPAH